MQQQRLRAAVVIIFLLEHSKAAQGGGSQKKAHSNYRANLLHTFALTTIPNSKSREWSGSQMKIKWSGLGMTDGSGKIGGNVAAKNRFGSYLRRKGQTINPQTVAQQAVRMAFGGLSQAWRALTSLQRSAWRALALFVTINDQFGDGYSPTGSQLYVRLNTNLAKVGVAANDDAPELVGAAQLDVPQVVVDFGPGATDAMDISVPNSVNSAAQDSILVIEATPPVSSGRSFGSVKNLYRIISAGAALPNQVYPPVTGATVNLAIPDFSTGVAANYAALFGIPASVNQNIFFRFSAVNAVTGESSPIISVAAQVLNTP